MELLYSGCEKNQQNEWLSIKNYLLKVIFAYTSSTVCINSSKINISQKSSIYCKKKTRLSSSGEI